VYTDKTLNFLPIMIIDLCSALLHKLNKNLEQLNNGQPIPTHLYSALHQQICRINTFNEDLLMARIDKIYKSLNSSVIVPPALVKLYHDDKHVGNDAPAGTLVGLIGQNIVKPLVEDVELHVNYECTCDVSEIPAELRVFDENMTWIDETNKESFLESLKVCKHVLMHAYLHTYRTYQPFTCIFLVKTHHGTYLIDTLKHKRMVARLSYECTYYKYMNGRTLHALKEEFKVVPCCCSLVKTRECYFVDFRIRPIHDDLLRLEVTHEKDAEASSEGVQQVVERMSAQNNVTGRERKVLEDILKLRDFVAKSNNESVNYVLTERQLCLILENMPKTKMQFKNVLPRCSPILRAHIEDILFILNESVEDSTRSYKEADDGGSSTVEHKNVTESKSRNGNSGHPQKDNQNEQRLNDRLKQIDIKSRSVNHLDIDSSIAKVRYNTFDYDENVVEKVKNKFRRRKK
ncbi:Exosome 3'-5' exoribonuclease complex, subunit PM/SCL-100 (Rrp6), partial [Trachipleistophora hominis]